MRQEEPSSGPLYDNGRWETGISMRQTTPAPEGTGHGWGLGREVVEAKVSIVEWRPRKMACTGDTWLAPSTTCWGLIETEVHLKLWVVMM